MQNDVQEDITKIISKHPEGLSIYQVAKALNIHRHTVSKYVYALTVAGVLEQRERGRAKLCFLKRRKS